MAQLPEPHKPDKEANRAVSGVLVVGAVKHRVQMGRIPEKFGCRFFDPALAFESLLQPVCANDFAGEVARCFVNVEERVDAGPEAAHPQRLDLP